MADKKPPVSLRERITEPPPQTVEVPKRTLKAKTRRDFLLYGIGVGLAAFSFWWTLPDDTQMRLGRKTIPLQPGKDKFLARTLAFDDDVAKALSSPSRLLPTYAKSEALSPKDLRNNYNLAPNTPADLFPDYVADWTLTVTGLASGKTETLRMPDIEALQKRFGPHEQVTRLVCVEGWSAIAWWAGLRFGDFLTAYPPAPGMKWAKLQSDVNPGTDKDNNLVADPYYVSIDLETARHPQTLLATHQSDAPLTVAHGAPLRLIAPMKLGLKNIKALTGITYSAHEPEDYWYERGYSKYDGI